MMSELTRLRDEALRLLTTYADYKDCDDVALRRKVHVDMDRFLMEHRATAMTMMITGLDQEVVRRIAELQSDPLPKTSWRQWFASLRDKRSGGSQNLVGNMAAIPTESSEDITPA